MQSPLYASRKFQAPQAEPPPQQKKLGFSPVPNIAGAIKHIWNDGMFNPRGDMQQVAKSVPLPPNFLQPTEPPKAEALQAFGPQRNRAFGQPHQLEIPEALQASGFQQQQPMTFSAYNAPLQTTPAPDGWIEGPDDGMKAMQLNDGSGDLQQRALDEISRAGGMQALQSQPPMQMQQPPMQRFGMPDNYMQQPNMQPNMPQMPIQFDPSQRPQSKMAGMDASQLVGPAFSNMQRANELMRSQLEGSMDYYNRGAKMNSYVSPMANILGAVFPGANRTLQQYSRGIGQGNDAFRDDLNKQMQAMYQNSMQTSKFADDYERYWNPNSPTNQNRAMDDSLNWLGKYMQAQQNNTAGYNAYTDRVNKAQQIPLEYNKQAIDMYRANTDQQRHDATAKYNDAQTNYNLKQLEQRTQNDAATLQDRAAEREFKRNQGMTDYERKQQEYQRKHGDDSQNQMIETLLKINQANKDGVRLADDPALMEQLRKLGRIPAGYGVKQEEPQDDGWGWLRAFQGKPQQQQQAQPQNMGAVATSAATDPIRGLATSPQAMQDNIQRNQAKNLAAQARMQGLSGQAALNYVKQRMGKPAKVAQR